MKKTCKKILILVCVTAILLTTFGRYVPVYAENGNRITGTILAKALEWIKQTQNDNESYGDAQLINDTTDVLEILRDNGMEEENTWLVEHSSEWENNTDSLARLYNATGREEYLQKMLTAQNKDGGFGLNADFQSDMLDSALAYEALVRKNIPDQENRQQLMQLMEYLKNRQNDDGGYSYIPGNRSDYLLTAQIAIITTAYIRYAKESCDEEWTKKMESYLLQEALELEEEHFIKAAYQQMYLCLSGIITDTGELEARLQTIRQEDGSFYGKPEETKAAVKLLWAIEEINKPYININGLTTELSTYVLYGGFESAITVEAKIAYKTNQQHDGILLMEVICDGEILKQEEETIIFEPEMEEISLEKELVFTGETGKQYEIRTQLLMEAVVIQSETDALNVQNPHVDELILSGSNAEGEIQLEWNDVSNEFYRYGYRICRQTEEKEWETRSSWDGEEKVRVLNVYPCPVAENYLKNWMTDELSNGEGMAGKGLFEIDTVYIGAYNADPDKYLMDIDGNYKYDVLFFGAHDSNAFQDLNGKSYLATQKFIDAGRGVLFGHDTVVPAWSNFMRFAEQLGIKVIYGSASVINNKVKIVNEGSLTSYPWKICGMLEIPASHANQQYTGGTLPATVWMEFVDGGYMDPVTGGCANAYLFTHNQLAMIQTGHSNGQATDDERKVLANTLFYLKQLTHETRMEDKSATDITSPVINEISEIAWEGENLNILIDSKDLGTCYRYYVEGIPEGNDTEALRKQSDTVTAEVISGILGYEVLADTSSMNVDDWTKALFIECRDGNLNILHEAAEGQQEYLHIRAVDSAGNRSAETVTTIPENKIQEDCFASGYGLFGEADVTAYVQELMVEQDVYSGGNLTCAGSGITILGNASAVGQMNLYTGSRTITGQEQVQALEMPQLHESILFSMGGTENLEVLNAYESTQIDYPAWCMTTTGAYCPEIKLNASLMCDNTINIGAGSVECGGEKNVALYSVNGDININASSLTGRGLIYAPNGNITINVQDMEFTGSIIAKRITIQGSMIHIGQPEGMENETGEKESMKETETKEWENSQENINEEE